MLSSLGGRFISKPFDNNTTFTRSVVFVISNHSLPPCIVLLVFARQHCSPPPCPQGAVPTHPPIHPTLFRPVPALQQSPQRWPQLQQLTVQVVAAAARPLEPQPQAGVVQFKELMVLLECLSAAAKVGCLGTWADFFQGCCF